jgi:ribonuclease G
LGDPVIELRASASPGEVRVAAVQDGKLLDYLIWRPGSPDGFGDLYRGRVIARVPAMAGAFVTLDGASDGFLPDSEGGKLLTEGSVVGVRVTRAAQGGKGPRLTAMRADCGPGPIGLVRRGPNPLLELAERFPQAPVLVDDAALVGELRVSLGGRVRRDGPAFHEDLAAAIEGLEQPVVELTGGARLLIHPTPALVAIDIDAGGAIAMRGGKNSQHAALNRAVLPALAVQIRLRNLSGAIVVDLAGLSVRKRSELAAALTASLACDPLEPRFLGFTSLGLAEIVRPRRRPPLHEMLAGPHATGLAALRAIAANLDPDPRRMPALRAAPGVVTALQRDPVALADLARRAGRDLILHADPALPESGWIMEHPHG